MGTCSPCVLTLEGQELSPGEDAGIARIWGFAQPHSKPGGAAACLRILETPEHWAPSSICWQLCHLENTLPLASDTSWNCFKSFLLTCQLTFTFPPICWLECEITWDLIALSGSWSDGASSDTAAAPQRLLRAAAQGALDTCCRMRIFLQPPLGASELNEVPRKKMSWEKKYIMVVTAAFEVL